MPLRNAGKVSPENINLLSSGFFVPEINAVWSSWQLAGLITRRSSVQVRSPLPSKKTTSRYPQRLVYFSPPRAGFLFGGPDMNIFKSKTINFSLAVGILGAAQANLPALQGVISPAAYGWSMFFISVVYAGLRSLTPTSLSYK